MRAAKSLPALQAVVAKWRPRVVNWSDKWKSAAEQLHGECHERLGGTLQAPKDSAARWRTGPTHEHLQQRSRRMVRRPLRLARRQRHRRRARPHEDGLERVPRQRDEPASSSSD